MDNHFAPLRHYALDNRVLIQNQGICVLQHYKWMIPNIFQNDLFVIRESSKSSHYLDSIFSVLDLQLY